MKDIQIIYCFFLLFQLYFFNAKKYIKFKQNIKRLLLICMISHFNVILNVFLEYSKSPLFIKT